MTNTFEATPRHTEMLQILHTLNAEAMQGCGLSYEFYAQKFTRAVDSYLPKIPTNDQTDFIEAATKLYCYGDDDLDFDENTCQHGIEYGCCPAGCDKYVAEDFQTPQYDPGEDIIDED